MRHPSEQRDGADSAAEKRRIVDRNGFQPPDDEPNKQVETVMTTRHDSVFLLLTGTILVLCTFLSADAGPPAAHVLEIKVQVSGPTFAQGDSIPVSIRLLNMSNGDILVGRYLANFKNAPTSLTISVEDEQGQRSEGSYGYIEMTHDVAQRWWIEIPPGNSYGLDTKLVSSAYPLLKTTGKRCVTAIYASSGESISATFRRPTSARRDILAKAWVGEIRSEPACFEIIGSQRSRDRVSH
jgi:hypothetical protein